MKSYPSINDSSAGRFGEPCYVFVKYDGSGIRAEWSSKRGWYKFGCRNTLMDESTPVFGAAIPIFLAKYGDDLEKVFRTNSLCRKSQNVIVFAEYFGPKSFSGMHKPGDTFDVVVFDVNPHKQGILSPRQFVDIFGHLPVAEVLATTQYSSELVNAVRTESMDIASKYAISNNLPEGVVVKGSSGHDLWMAKIKTNRYREALKEHYEADWIKFWE